MKALLKRVFDQFKQVFLTTPNNWKQFLIILVVSMLFIGMPQKPPIDWDLNTNGFWSNIPRTYLKNQNFVYPPWGLILLLPYYLIRAAGSRMLSVITIGWLVKQRKWSLSYFFAIVLSPYFMVTMAKSSMDILVVVLPILIWNYSTGKRWEIIARGISLSMLLLKPQCTVLIIVFLLWQSRKEWQKVLLEGLIVAAFILPVSIIGSPPLIIQWLNNIFHPSAQNQYYWSINNISLTAKYGIIIAIGILLASILIFYILSRIRFITWKDNHTISALLLISMYLLPYSSQQSFSSGLAFIPSWPGFFLQWLGVALGLVTFGYNNNIPIWSFSIAFLSIFFFALIDRRSEKKLDKKTTNLEST